jgi:ABC-2 type transport system ATP-binding protein
MILIENVSKIFNNKWAVKGLHIQIEKGEIFGLLGPNGAGKTTTIKMMTGLLRPTEGRILIDGFDIVKEHLQAKSILGYVPDKAFLYEKLKGREFLTFVASIHRIKKPEAQQRIDELLSIFGIKEVGGELIESYSQGMKQRLLFLSSLIHNPHVLLIDEPFVGLDPFGVIMIKEVIQKLSSEGVSIFLATHSLHIAEDLCERVGLISKGILTHIISKEDFKTKGDLQKLFLEMTEKR